MSDLTRHPQVERLNDYSYDVFGPDGIYNVSGYEIDNWVATLHRDGSRTRFATREEALTFALQQVGAR